MDVRPIDIELPQCDGRSLPAALPPDRDAAFGEPDGAILAWIASHVRNSKVRRRPN